MGEKMSDLAYRAMMFAREAHKDQVRKYTGNPYSDHLAEVAGIVSTLNLGQVVLATAWLHDCVEDCGVSLATIEDEFGVHVAIGVSGLSDIESGNRSERKQLSRERLASCSAWIQSVKCADLISNTSSIVMHDPKFAVTYLEEKRLLLDVMTKADPRLLALARSQTVLQEQGDEK
jgi:(p)ppGpp synthase/HD superfamily hydrolase